VTPPALDVPEFVRRKAMSLGSEGESWLRDLPELVRALAREWDVVVGSALDGGTESYVTSAMTRDGVAVVMKLEIPGDTSFTEKARTLMSASGRGYVRLLRHDDQCKAMLQERLGPSLASSGLPVASQIEILCSTLEQAWDARVDAPLETGADKARRLAAFISAVWEKLGRPCSEGAIELALAFAGSREAAFEPAAAVVVHGDAHAGNALRAGGHGSTFKFVDPESFLAERAYDLGISMREWSGELLDGDPLQLGIDRCLLLGRLAGVAPQPIWEWGFLERVSTGLFCLDVGIECIGREILAVADIWSDAASPVGDGRLAPR
jgi:streptomycin 6-kinase